MMRLKTAADMMKCEPVFYDPKDWEYTDAFLDVDPPTEIEIQEEYLDRQGHFDVKIGHYEGHGLYIRGEWTQFRNGDEKNIYVCPFPEGEWIFDIEYLGNAMSPMKAEKTSQNILNKMWGEYESVCDSAYENAQKYFDAREDEIRYKILELFRTKHPEEYFSYKARFSGLSFDTANTLHRAVTEAERNNPGWKSNVDHKFYEHAEKKAAAYISRIISECHDCDFVLDKYMFSSRPEGCIFKDDNKTLHINSHNLAAELIDNCMEPVLEEYGMQIPDEDRTGNEEEACLYGMAYGEASDRIEERIIKYFEPLAREINEPAKDTMEMDGLQF